MLKLLRDEADTKGSELDGRDLLAKSACSDNDSIGVSTDLSDTPAPTCLDDIVRSQRQEPQKCSPMPEWRRAKQADSITKEFA
jgi:hypothetical protein